VVKEGGREGGREGLEEAQGTACGVRRDFWRYGGAVLDVIKEGEEDREDGYLFLSPFLVVLLLCCSFFSLEQQQQQ